MLQGEDEYFSGLGVYDGYDSYQDGSGSSSEEGDDEDDDTYYPSAIPKIPYRFINGKDGMGKFVTMIITDFYMILLYQI